MKFVVFSGIDEIIVTSYDDEERVIREYFTNGGRNIDEYCREMYKGEICIATRLVINGDPYG